MRIAILILATGAAMALSALAVLILPTGAPWAIVQAPVLIGTPLVLRPYARAIRQAAREGKTL
jgi:hypothetical protein